MALFVSVGGFFIQQPDTEVTWWTTYGTGLDRRVVIQAPNITDDILGVVQLVVLNQGVVATSDNSLAYSVTIRNPSSAQKRDEALALEMDKKRMEAATTPAAPEGTEEQLQLVRDFDIPGDR